MLDFLPCKDILRNGHCAPALVIFVASVVAAVQGDTLLVLHFGFILFFQTLYSLTILLKFDCRHIVAYFLALLYGLTIVHPACFFTPAGVLACLAYATMTTHYVYCYSYNEVTQEQTTCQQNTNDQTQVDFV